MKNLIDKIRLLRDKRRAVILAHNYQLPEVQDLADFTGDSLELSRKAAATDAEVIVFCGVWFMAETAAILCPGKPVLIPDPQAEETFLNSKLKWDELEAAPHRELLAWHRQLIRLRRDTPALREGGFEELDLRYEAREPWLAVRRGPLSVVYNFGEESRLVPGLDGEVILSTSPENVALREGAAYLPGRSVVILG